MTGNAKLVYSSVILFALLAAAFFGGVYLGNQHGIVSTTMLLDWGHALDNVVVIRRLKNGDINGAVEYLDLSTDVKVLVLDGFRRSPYLVTPMDKELISHSLIVLKKIAKDRKARPNRGHTGNVPEIDRKVQSILESIEAQENDPHPN